MILSPSATAQQRWHLLDHIETPGRAVPYSLGTYGDSVIVYSARYFSKIATVVRYSSDRGRTWQEIRVDSIIGDPDDANPDIFPVRLYSLEVPSADVIVLAGDRGTIWATQDRGESWQTHRMGRLRSRIPVLSMVDSAFGVAMQVDTIWTTRDGGATWSGEWIDTSRFGGYYPVQLKLFSRTRWLMRGVVPGASQPGMHMISEDAGKTWTTFVDPTDRIREKDEFYLDSLRMYVVGPPDTVPPQTPLHDVLRRSTDGGRTWETVYYQLNDWQFGLLAVAFVDSMHGFVSRREYVLRTEDGGRTWIDANSGRTIEDEAVGMDDFIECSVMADGAVVGLAASGRVWIWEGTSGVGSESRSIPGVLDLSTLENKE